MATLTTVGARYGALTFDLDSSLAPTLDEATQTAFEKVPATERAGLMADLLSVTLRQALRKRPGLDLDRDVEFPYLGLVNLRSFLDQGDHVSRTA